MEAKLLTKEDLREMEGKTVYVVSIIKGEIKNDLTGWFQVEAPYIYNEKRNRIAFRSILTTKLLANLVFDREVSESEAMKIYHEKG